MTDYKNLKRFTKSQINGLTKHLYQLRFSNNIATNNEKIFERAAELGLEVDYNNFQSMGEKFIFKTPRKITKEQTILGKNWLKSWFFKLNGSPRSGQRTQYVNDNVLNIVKNVSRFEFVGVYGCYNNYGEFIQFLPIYRTFDSKGNYFDYAPIHWSGPLVGPANEVNE